MNIDNNDNKIISELKIGQQVHLSNYQDNDFTISDKESMKRHNEYYDNILCSYSDKLKGNLAQKHFYKKIFFWICVSILIVILLFFIGITWWIAGYVLGNPDITFDLAGIVSVITGTAVTFLTSFMILPKIITDYLFNKDEEKNMMQIIENIQKHDLTIRNDIRHTNNKIEND